MLDAVRWGPAKGVAEQLVVLCHGVGANGRDLIDLAPPLAAALPHAAFVSPDAPQPYDMAPIGRQWYPIGDHNPALMAAGAAQTAPLLSDFIDAELTRLTLPADAYALIGFSQGAMMVLFTGLRRLVAPKAIIAFSGALLAPDKLAAERRNAAPVLLVHGEADPVVPVIRSHDAEATLKAVGIPVDALYIPGLGHGIEQSGLQKAAATLRQAFMTPG